MTNRIFLGDRNHLDTATLSGGSWETDAPIENLQNTDVSQSARTTDALTTSTIVQWDHGAAQTHQAVAIINHNLSATAQVRLSLGTTAGGAEVYAGDWVDAWQVETRSQNGANFMVVILLPTAPGARYGKLEISDASNADGYVEIGRMVACEGLMPTYNAEAGLAAGFVDTSSSARTQGGRRQSIPGRAYRVVEFSLPIITNADAELIHDIQLTARTVDGILWLPNLTDAEACQRYGMWAVMDTLQTLSWLGPRRKSASRIRLEEL